MKLYEFEGHQIFAMVGIQSPFFVVCSNLDEVKQARKRLKFPVVAKVQVLSGKRGKGGGIKICKVEDQLLTFCKSLFGKQFADEDVQFVELAEKVDFETEFYMSITYDSISKIPFLLFSDQGGMDIEEIKKTNPDAIVRVDLDPFVGPTKKELDKRKIPADFAFRLWDAFWRYDCRLVEVNPLVKTTDGRFLALDSKVILDDSGLSRHKDLDVVAKGAISAIPTERELAAKQIDAEDYRGSAGSKFIEFDGDIAILASGGGASLLIMDAVVDAGGKPSNYTEYSGNPPREKVEKLTKITLSKERLRGCLVAGAVANFTDIYETLAGFADGLKQVKPKVDYPIVIRRGGPRQKEAYEMLETLSEKEGYDIQLFGPETPISVACKKMVELAKKYKAKA